jgi:hypothetical protein
MISRIAVPSLLLALLTPPLHADKFYFASDTDQKKTVGNAAQESFVEGVLLKEDKDSYTIRIMGGEMTVAKAMVKKIERDGLTVAQIEAREAARKDQLAQQETNRRQLQAAAAAARREAQAAEAAMRRDRRGPSQLNIDVDFGGIIGQFRTGGRAILPYDPVIRRSNLSGLPAIVDTYMQALLDAQRNIATSRPARSLPVAINFSSTLSPLRFLTFEPSEITQRDLDVLQKQIYSHVQEQVLLAAHQNSSNERMNLPYRKRQ